MSKQSGDECVRVHRYTMSKQSGTTRARAQPTTAVHRHTMSKQSGPVHRYTMSKQSGPVHRYTMSKQCGPTRACAGTAIAALFGSLARLLPILLHPLTGPEPG
jgi:hypothetical protein